MEFHHEFLPDRNLVIVRITGLLSLGPLLEALVRLWEHPSYHPDLDMLCHLSGAKAQASAENVPELDQFLKDPRAARGRRAIVIQDPTVTALTMLYMRNLPHEGSFRIFSTLAAAHEYLEVADPIAID